MTDVIIIGGGPAGAAMGCYLAKAGIDHVIIERSNFPRSHVGESMVTATTRIFDEIGFLPTMEAEGFPHKFGASWHPTNGKMEYDIAFKEFPQEGVHQDYTYHVDRSRFDLLLLGHAESLGSRVMQGVSVKDLLMDGERVRGVQVEVEGQRVDLEAKIVVDASGRDTLIGRKLGFKQNDPIFDQFAVHAWYEDVARGDGRSKDYIHIYFLPFERGWAWQIPITDKVTSIGVVAEKEVFKNSSKDVEAYMESMLASNAALERAMAPARRVNDLKREGNYSYSMSQFCGDGYVILGDAARFVDPIFSSGVSVAMHSAKFVLPVIQKALETGDTSREVFLPYEEKLKRGVTVWYEFIKLYYRLLPMFTRFIQDDEHRLQLLQLLQGDVYDKAVDVPVLVAMRECIEAVEASEGHLWQNFLQEVDVRA